MGKLTLMQVSSLEKIFLKQKPKCKEMKRASVLKGEEYSYQIVYHDDGKIKIDASVQVRSPLAEYITIKKVGNVPSELPVQEHNCDDDILTDKPGLFPDVLYPLKGKKIEIINASYHSLWITVKLDENVKPGIYKISLVFQYENYDVCKTKEMEIEIIDATLPKQRLIYTQWFHTDCIASYYNVKVFSKKHWDMIDKFIEMAADNGVNMILTPVFTPPLDTKVGGERPTVQLVDIEKNGDEYTFCFDKLTQWIALCKKHKIEYFEMPHLFTQWGAEFTPKIVARESGKQKKIFGWHVRANSEKYKIFLNAFIPKLIECLKENEIDKNTYFHISDEPNEKHLDTYRAARRMVEELIAGYQCMDALSSYDYYKLGLVKTPVPATNHIEPFLENNVKDLWTYYCVSQAKEVSNRFMAMPSYRNRIIATQFYKYDIAGFLQWGYNFYYSQLSKEKINPFMVTDAISAFPSGDAFSVYPGPGGPIESIRLKVFKEALQDVRAMQLLEQYMPKSDIIKLMEEEAEEEITFKRYPKNAQFILNMREKINRSIAEHIK